MNKISRPIFPTLINEYSSFLSQSQCDDVYHYIKRKNENNNHSALFGNAVSSHGVKSEYGDIIDEIDHEIFSCKGIKHNLDLLLNDYAKDIGINPVKVTNSWYNIEKKNSMLCEHVHPGSVVSAALYIKVDENSHNLYFQNPNPFIEFSNIANFDKLTDYTYMFYYLTPENGKIILFPSWLKHGAFYNQNMSDERISISLNSNYSYTGFNVV